MWTSVLLLFSEAMEKDPKIRDILQRGDYNFPFILWENKSIYEPTQKDRQYKASVKEQGELLINYMEEHIFTIKLLYYKVIMI